MKMLGSFTILISTILFSACENKTEFAKGDCVQKPDSMVVWKYEGKGPDGHKLSQSANPSLPLEKTEENVGSYIKSVCR